MLLTALDQSDKPRKSGVLSFLESLNQWRNLILNYNISGVDTKCMPGLLFANLRIWFKGQFAFLFFKIYSHLSFFISDPIKTAQGSLSLKAYRLTPKLMEICKEKDFTPEGWVAHNRVTLWIDVMIGCTQRDIAFLFKHKVTVLMGINN